MGGAKRYPSMPERVTMGIASLHPSYENTLSRSRDADRPRFAINFPPSLSEGAGKTGCALHPRSRVHLHTKNAYTSIQVQRKHSGLPEGLDRFWTDLPVVLICRSCASRLRLPAKQISSQFVGWAKRSVPTIRMCTLDGGHV